MDRPKVGAVVIGRNEGQRLSACLHSLNAAGLMDLVYVDSGSTDQSLELARSAGAHVIRLDLAQPFTAARARNEGFFYLMARDNAPRFVQFIDGDCRLTEGWIEAAQRFLESDPGLAAVCGRRREIEAGKTVYNWLCDIEWNTPVGEALAFGGDVLMRSAALFEAGGYRDDLICGEEPELCVRLRAAGWRIMRADADMTFHDAAIDRFSQWWRRAKRGGFAYAKVSLLHWKSPYGIWKREMASSLLYGGVLPLCILACALIHPALLLLWLIYPLLIIRIAARRGARKRESWIYAFFLVLGKFAEFGGILRYLAEIMQRKRAKLIEYK